MSDIRGKGGVGFIDEAAFHKTHMAWPRRCRVCGCTGTRACMTEDGPCFWLEEDLCSGCLDREDGNV